MAEIKSSIELAMERTKGLTFTDEERRKLQEEKERRLAQAVVSQYVRGEINLSELERKRLEASPSARLALDRALLESLSWGMDNFPLVLEAMQRFLGKGHRKVLQRLKDLSIEWGQLLQKRRRKLKAELREELARRQVEGSAVEPHVEGSPLWGKALRELQVQFQDRLLEAQELIGKALESPENQA
jgi:DNA-binding LacI/PurR family transcriptional regulator